MLPDPRSPSARTSHGASSRSLVGARPLDQVARWVTRVGLRPPPAPRRASPRAHGPSRGSEPPRPRLRVGDPHDLLAGPGRGRGGGARPPAGALPGRRDPPRDRRAARWRATAITVLCRSASSLASRARSHAQRPRARRSRRSRPGRDVGSRATASAQRSCRRAQPRAQPGRSRSGSSGIGGTVARHGRERAVIGVLGRGGSRVAARTAQVPAPLARGRGLPERGGQRCLLCARRSARLDGADSSSAATPLAEGAPLRRTLRGRRPPGRPAAARRAGHGPSRPARAGRAGCAPRRRPRRSEPSS